MDVMSTISDDEFIDMELSLSISSSCSSPTHQSRDFEFQMSDSVINFPDRSADELFYQGKLLPLVHIPSSNKLHKLLTQQNFNAKIERAHYHDHDHISSLIIASSTNTSSPLVDSGNISPSQSCRVSCDLDPDDDCFFEWSNELRGFTHHQQLAKKRSSNWSKRLYHKLKSSRTYLRSLFTKSTMCNVGSNTHARPSFSADKKKNINPFERNDGCKKMVQLKDLVENHRRSFSGAIQRRSGSGSVSSSSSSSSSSSTPSASSLFAFNNFNMGYDFQLLKRSSSANSELESSIEGAIAHCKRSQNLALAS